MANEMQLNLEDSLKIFKSLPTGRKFTWGAREKQRREMQPLNEAGSQPLSPVASPKKHRARTPSRKQRAESPDKRGGLDLRDLQRRQRKIMKCCDILLDSVKELYINLNIMDIAIELPVIKERWDDYSDCEKFFKGVSAQLEEKATQMNHQVPHQVHLMVQEGGGGQIGGALFSMELLAKFKHIILTILRFMRRALTCLILINAANGIKSLLVASINKLLSLFFAGSVVMTATGAANATVASAAGAANVVGTAVMAPSTLSVLGTLTGPNVAIALTFIGVLQLCNFVRNVQTTELIVNSIDNEIGSSLSTTGLIPNSRATIISLNTNTIGLGGSHGWFPLYECIIGHPEGVSTCRVTLVKLAPWT